MSEAVAEKPVCSECGAEPLGKALFCYSCGAALAVGTAPAEAEKAEADSDEQTESKTDVPITPPEGMPFPGKNVEGDEGEDSEAEPEPVTATVKTASDIRRMPKVSRMRRIETRWVPEGGAPNLWFLISAVFLAVVAFVVFLLSMQLR